jgi:Rieske Fe-S protein
MSTRHDDLGKGEGKVLADRHIALYRNEGGGLRAMSSVCTHRGCDVHWNPDEKVWDCPCHGSRFAPDGTVLRGPAMQPLPLAEAPDEA